MNTLYSHANLEELNYFRNYHCVCTAFTKLTPNLHVSELPHTPKVMSKMCLQVGLNSFSSDKRNTSFIQNGTLLITHGNRRVKECTCIYIYISTCTINSPCSQ